MNLGLPNPEVPQSGSVLKRLLCAGVLALLLVGQGATTLTLFNSRRSTSALLDDRPIMDGGHPLHFYHAGLGARSWKGGGCGSCYDPAFQAGYPKTPIFDSGSRPGELFLLLGGERPQAYKIGLAICCLLAPLTFAASARLLDLPSSASCVAAGLGILMWWSGPVQQLLVQGHLDWLLTGLVLVMHAALAVRFHRDGGPLVWFGLLATAALGWFLHPILWVGFALLFLPFHVCVAMSHDFLWNFALLFAWAGGFGLNLPWLNDWLRFCWIQMPVPLSTSQSWHFHIDDWFPAEVGGGWTDRWLTATILIGGMFGVAGQLVRRRFSAGMTFGATALVLPVLSLGTGLWKPLELIGVAKLFVLAVSFAVVPCAAAMRDLHDLLVVLTRHPVRGALFFLVLIGGLGVWFREDLKPLCRQASQAKPLRMGLTSEQAALVRHLRSETRPEARILWEERPCHPTPTWTALLPQYVGRSFLGGLDPEAAVDHAHARLTSTHLAGRPLTDWTDAELEAFCARYNVGYIVCWSPETAKRFRAWAMIESHFTLHEDGEGCLLTVNRPHSLILKGKARIAQLDDTRIALADVEPDDGVVVLALHHQEGFRVFPSTVTVEREPDADDPIPRLRLRMPGPMLRVTLTWGKP